MVEAVPLKADKTRFQVDLLHQRVGDGPVGWAAVGAQIATDRVVDGEQSGALRPYFEGVQVWLVAIAGTNDRDVFVGTVGDHDSSVTTTGGSERVLPPGEDGPAFVFLHSHVCCSGTSGDCLKPHEPTSAIENHRPVLPRAGVRREEDVAGRLGAGIRSDRHRRRVKVRAR